MFVNANPEKYIGVTCTMNCGLEATIIAYRTYNDIDIQFEDGTIRLHTNVKSFNKGQIAYPQNLPERYIGMSNAMNCGLTATIIAYRKYKDIDVQFEDGTVRKHVSVMSFVNREIAPERNVTTDDNKEKYIGMSRIMNCGVKATIIDYYNYNDITVQFENGEIREHAWLHYFNKGALSPEHYNIVLSSEKYLGQSHLMYCGLKATVIAYRNNSDIDIKFEDGVVCKHKSASNFMSCRIAHPTLQSSVRVTGTLFDMFTVHDKAFVYHDTAYFDVSYIDDNIELRDILSVQDMKNRAGIQQC